MTPVPPPSTRGAKLKHRYDLVKRDKPLTISLEEKSSDKLEARIRSIRSNACAWGARHGVLLVTRITYRSPNGLNARLEVHWSGRRT